MVINLVKNPDILAEVAALAKRPICVGFAAETNDVSEYARQKLINKKLDLIVANQVGNQETGFGSNDNVITLITSDSEVTLPRASKTVLAQQIIAAIAERLS